MTSSFPRAENSTISRFIYFLLFHSLFNDPFPLKFVCSGYQEFSPELLKKSPNWWINI
jgi:hypothetical protein